MITLVEVRRGQCRGMPLEQSEDRHLLLEKTGLRWCDSRTGVGPVDKKSLGFEPAYRLAHWKLGDTELLGDRIDHDPETGAIGATENPLTDRVVEPLLLGWRSLDRRHLNRYRI